MKWKIILSKQATKDAKKLTRANLAKKTQKLLKIIETNPYKPPYEKLKAISTATIQGELTSNTDLYIRHSTKIKLSEFYGCGVTTNNSVVAQPTVHLADQTCNTNAYPIFKPI